MNMSELRHIAAPRPALAQGLRLDLAHWLGQADRWGLLTVSTYDDLADCTSLMAVESVARQADHIELRAGRQAVRLRTDAAVVVAPAPGAAKGAAPFDVSWLDMHGQPRGRLVVLAHAAAAAARAALDAATRPITDIDIGLDTDADASDGLAWPQRACATHPLADGAEACDALQALEGPGIDDVACEFEGHWGAHRSQGRFARLPGGRWPPTARRVYRGGHLLVSLDTARVIASTACLTRAGRPALRLYDDAGRSLTFGDCAAAGPRPAWARALA